MATKKFGFKESGTGSFGFKLDEDGDAKLGNSSNDLIEVTGTLDVNGDVKADKVYTAELYSTAGNREIVIATGDTAILNDLRAGINNNPDTLVVDRSEDKVAVGKNLPLSSDAHIFEVFGDISASVNISGSGLYTDKLNIEGTDVTATAAELNYVDGVNSNIQAQLNTNASGIATNSTDISTVNSSKANLNSPAFTGTSTFASQPGFLARLSADQTNISANAAQVTVEFDAEEYDIGSDFNTTTHQFTAPTTGRYFFSTFVYMKNIPEAAEYFYVQLATTTADYRLAIIDPNELDTNIEYRGFQGSIVVQLTAGDTAKIEVVYQGTSSTADIDGGSINNTSWFNGYFMG